MGPRNTASESFQGRRTTDHQSTNVSGRGSRNNGWCWQKIILHDAHQHQDAPFVRMKGADKALGKDTEAESTLIRTLSHNRGGATPHR